MATTGGATLKDFLPIPDTLDPVVDPLKTETPTASHALAVADHELKGAAQDDHDMEVKDLGWKDHVADVPRPLVGGLPNDELWILLRRFNKVSLEVKTCVRLGALTDFVVSKCTMSRTIRIPFLETST
jgi:hypothetical protein